MTTRSTLYRCNLFSFGGPQTTGIESRWTIDLLPIGETEVLSGEEVELYALVDGSVHDLGDRAAIRFDILEEDFLLTGGLDDRVVSLVGTGASVEEAEFPVSARTTVFRELNSGETPQAVLGEFRRSNTAYRDQILVMTERAATSGGGSTPATKYHIVTWWVAERLEDWANSEMYFIVSIDGAEDQSEETLDVSPTRAPDPNAAVLPWTITSSVRRIHTLLETGVLDWKVSGDEAMKALKILRALPPRELMEVVVYLKLGNTWTKLEKALAENDAAELVELHYLLDPDRRFLLAGDVIRLTIRAGEVVEQTQTLPVRSDGVTVYPELVVPVAGLLPEDAATAIARALLDGWFKEPSVTLAVTRRRHAYIDSKAPSGLVEFDSVLPREVRDSPSYKRDVKHTRFMEFVAPLEHPKGKDRMAVALYMDWMATHRNEEIFLTREPEDLWSWAYAQASAPPPTTPVTKFLELYHSMVANLDDLPADERSDRVETSRRFISWLDQHTNDSSLATIDPIEIWAKMGSDVLIERVNRDIAKRQAEAREQAHRMDVEAAGTKIDETLEFLIKHVFHLWEPYTIDVKSEGYGYLVMPSEFEKKVREATGKAFLSHVIEKLGNDQLRPRLMATPIKEEFEEWLDANPELREALRLATTYPYVEKYDIEVELTDFQTAVEIVAGCLPIIGQIVAIKELATGRSLYGRRLGTIEMAISGAALFLPVARIFYKGGKGLVTAARIANDYRLSVREANVLYRAAFPVRPGSAGEKVLNKLFGEVEQQGSIKSAVSIGEAQRLLREMGLFDREIVEVLGMANVNMLTGARLATVVETETMLAKVLGTSDLATIEFRAMSSEGKGALRAALKDEPEFLRRAIEAETDTGLKRYRKAITDKLKAGGMPEEQAETLGKTIDLLNLRRRELIGGQLERALKDGTDKLLVQRLDELARGSGVRHEGEVWIAALRKRVNFHRANNNAERAREIEREIGRIESWLGKSGDAAADAKLQSEARLLADSIAGTDLANRVREGAGNTIQYLWLRFRITKMTGALTPAQAREAFVEYVGHASKNFLGNYGEFEVAFRLGRTHILLKAPDGMVNLPGTDLVAIPRDRGRTMLIDNKALNADQVDSVTALTRNLSGNFVDDLDDFVKLSNAADVPDHLRLTIQRMTKAKADLEAAGLLELSRSARRSETVQKQIVDILNKNEIDVVVTNAGGKVTTISDDLEEIGLDLLDLNKPVNPSATP